MTSHISSHSYWKLQKKNNSTFHTLGDFLVCVHSSKYDGSCPEFEVQFDVLENCEFISVQTLREFLDTYVGDDVGSERLEYERERVKATIKTYGRYNKAPSRFNQVGKVSEGRNHIFERMEIPQNLGFPENVTFEQMLDALKDKGTRKNACKLIVRLVAHLIKQCEKSNAKSKKDEDVPRIESDSEHETDDGTQYLGDDEV